jgi:N utilization substance protein B
MGGGSRQLARQAAVQALYQWDMTKQNRLEIEANFLSDSKLQHSDLEYFQHLITDIPRQVEDIDAAAQPFLDRDMSKVDPIERAILRLSVFELMNHMEIPYRVVINEGIELAKTFGADNSYRFINGILDKMVATFRELEVAAANR